MRMTILVLALMFLSATGTAVSEAQLQEFKSEYNNQTEKVPDIASSIVGGETVNLEINRSDSEEVVGAEMNGLEISEIRKGGFENNTMVVETDGETVQTVLESEDPFDQIQSELDKNDIEYRSTTLSGSVKLTVLESIRGISNALGLQF